MTVFGRRLMMQPDPTVYPPDKVDNFAFFGTGPYVRAEEYAKVYEALQKACELLTACGYVGVY